MDSGEEKWEFSYSGSFDCWDFLCITGASLPYNIKQIEAKVVALWHYINKGKSN